MFDTFDSNMTWLLDELPTPVYVKNKDGLFIYANQAMLSLLQVEREQLIGSKIASIASPTIAQTSDHSDAALSEENKNVELICTLPTADGEELIILARKRLITLPDGNFGILCSLNDISQFVLYEKELEEKQRELRRQQGKLKELATIDPLTGIFNRRAFYDKAGEAIRYAEVGDLDIGVLMFDLDNFKKLNDTYGHATGDEVLVRFAKLVGDCIRGTDIFARLGGEEFVLFLPDTDERATRTIAARIRERTADTPILVNDAPVYYTTSVGGTMWRDSDTSIDTALSRADRSLYRAKEDGRNLVRFSLDYDDSVSIRTSAA